MKLKFRYIIYVMLCAVLLPLISVFVSPNINVSAQSQLEVEVKYRDNKIVKIESEFRGYSVYSVEDVYNLLNDMKSTFGFSSSKEALKHKTTTYSETGAIFRFEQYFNNIKVYGGEINVCVDNENRPYAIIGSYYNNILTTKEYVFPQVEAYEKVKSEYVGATIKLEQECLVIKETLGVLTYIYNVNDGLVSKRVFVNAQDLSIIKELSSTTSLRDTLSPSQYDITAISSQQTNVLGQSVTLSIDKYVSKTTSESFYVLSDKEKRIYVVDGQNKEENALGNYQYKFIDSETGIFEDSIAVQAYEYILKCYDFYADPNSFGEAKEGVRNTSDKVVDLIVIVHYGVNYENAACSVGGGNVGYFLFGDGNPDRIDNGDGTTTIGTKSFVNGLDVVGHEYQHSVTDSEVTLDYEYESGAIAEAFSDMFGAVIEGHDLDDPNFWRMGEDLYILTAEEQLRGTSYFFRDNSDPAKTNCTYSYLNLFNKCLPYCSHDEEIGCDRGGVHYNSTLMPYATYLMYKQDETFFTKTNILKLWWQTLLRLTTTSDFEDFADAMLLAAEALDYSDEKIRTIRYAFAEIDMPGFGLQGQGTVLSPYVISDISGLQMLQTYVNTNEGSGHYATARYKLANNIDLSGVVWEGIGTSSNPFNGVFNGNSCTITGFGNSSSFTGLFGVAGQDAYIYDLSIGEGDITTTEEYAGAIAGILYGTISGCSSKLNISGVNVGGLAGIVVNQVGADKIVNSFVSANVTGTVVGGITAVFASPKHTTVSSHITGILASNYVEGCLTGEIVGGIVGKANSFFIQNNLVLAQIKEKNTNSILGGFVGVSQFINPLTTFEVITKKVSNYVLGGKSVATFIKTGGSVAGTIFGKIEDVVSSGNIYVERTVVKNVEGVDYSSNGLSQENVKFVQTKTSQDSIYEGDFDFDNKKYYTNEDNWIRLEGIEAFDLTTSFKINNQNQMPTHGFTGFWLDNFDQDFDFDGGDGSETNPYKIRTAEQLSFLAYILYEGTYYSQYYSKNYILTSDIDLSGNIWTGLGYSIYTIVDDNVSNIEMRPFGGVIDGNGYTISNITSVGVNSVQRLFGSTSNYQMYQFSTSLLGETSAEIVGEELKVPEVKNLTLENVNFTGSNAAAVVSKAYYAINLSNVTVMGGTITSSGLSGGLIARIEGCDDVDNGETLSSVVSVIENCYTLVDVYGLVTGGAVGYITNSSSTTASTVEIINYLNRGNIRTSGIDYEAKYSVSDGSFSYYRATAGSVIGLTQNKNTKIINAINMGEVVAYNEQPMIGGFIGCVGVGDSYSSTQVNIVLDGCKQMGRVYYIFDNLLSSAGNILGGTNIGKTTVINLELTDTNYSMFREDIVNENQENVVVSTTTALNISDDERGEGDFDIYNNEYYSNSKYFNVEHQWSQKETERLYFTVTFRNYDGEIFHISTIKEGETIVMPTETPTKESTVAYYYVFDGWSEELTNVQRSMNVYAEYTEHLRSYDVHYIDIQGNVIETITQEYGSSIKQSVEAPEKPSNFFFQYEFVRWGAEGQTVSGEINVSPVYKFSLTGASIAIIFVLVILLCGGAAVFITKKKI